MRGPAGTSDTAAVLANLPCGVVSFDDDGVVLFTNATLRALLGFAEGELEGRHVERMLTIAGRIFYQTHVFPMLRLHGGVREVFLLLRHRDGAEIGALANATRTERDGAPVTDCVLMEVRERRKYEDELLHARRAADAANAALAARTRDLEAANATAEQANRAKSQFLTTMSHELRTPLNAIGGYAELIGMGIHGPVTPAQVAALERITRSQQHLLRLVNEVLNLARIEAGRLDYVLDAVAVSELFATVQPMVEPQMQSAGLTFESRAADGLVVRADRDKAEQVLINLLGNALKFTPRGGRVTLAAAPADDGAFVAIRVADEGIGIRADKLASIFEPFVQVRGEFARPHEGSGLGLAISRDLARGMGGELTAESVEGEGSTFTLTLPKAKAKAKA